MWEAPKDSILTISPAIASSVRSDNLACLPAHAPMCPSSFLGSVFPQLRSSGSLWHLPVSSNCLLAWDPCPVWCFLPAARSRPGRCLPSLVPLIGFNSLCRLPGPLFSCYAGGTWNLGSRLLTSVILLRSSSPGPGDLELHDSEQNEKGMLVSVHWPSPLLMEPLWLKHLPLQFIL